MGRCPTSPPNRDATTSAGEVNPAPRQVTPSGHPSGHPEGHLHRLWVADDAGRAGDRPSGRIRGRLPPRSR
jgi:hypothetical protein